MTRSWFPAVWLAAACGAAPVIKPPAQIAGVDARVERIERGLLPPVTVKGEEVRYGIEARMAAYKIPALGIAVFDDYELQWVKTYGHAEDGRRATNETVFFAGSIRRPVDSLAALHAVAEGTLALDAPLAGDRTLRAVLADIADPAAELTLAQFLDAKTRRPYSETVRRLVLAPLGMVRSSFDLPPDRRRYAAVGHDGNGHAISKRDQAGLWTTPTDLATLFLEIARARAGKGSQIARAIADQMTAKVSDLDGGGVGLGTMLSERNGVRFFGHDGTAAGFQARALVSMDGGRGLVIMTNSENGARIFPEIERAVFAEYGWPGRDTPIVRMALADTQRAKFTGMFQVGRAPFEITEHAGKLELVVPFEPPVELVPIASDVAVRCDDGSRIRIDDTGPVELTPPDRAPRPVIRATWRNHLFEIQSGKFDAAVIALRAHLQSYPKLASIEEAVLNNLGYQLMQRDLPKSIELLRLVATVIPDSSNAHDSLAEAYLLANDKLHAIASYERALAALDSDPRIPLDAKQTRRTRTEAQLAKLRAP